MSLDLVYDALEVIAATNSKLEKARLLTNFLKDHDFRSVVVAALNPFVTYGITAALAAEDDDGTRRSLEFSDVQQLLKSFSERKLTGHAARDELFKVYSEATAKSGEIIWRILNKDLRAGFSESTVNKVEKGLIPVFKVQLAKVFEPARIKKWPVIVEPKYDGVRVIVQVDPEKQEVLFKSRTGKPFTSFDHLKTPILEMVSRYEALVLHDEGCMEPFALDAEVVSGNFNATVSSVRRKAVQATDAVLLCFDMLRYDLTDGGVPYKKRRIHLEDLVDLAKTDKIVITEEEWVDEKAGVERIKALYEGYRLRGLEGAMVKDPDYRYEKKRNYSWMKIKNEDTVDVVITGAEEGTGKYAGTLGALIVDYNGKPVRVSGMSDALRDEMWAAYLQDRSTSNDKPMLLLGRMIEVEFHEETEDGSLRHPRFIRFRDDKQTDDNDED